MAAPTVVVNNGRINNAKLAAVVVDPCAGENVGDVCSNGVLYAGSGFAGLGSYKYMTTPGHCSGFVNNYTGFTPTCTGATDDLGYSWAANNDDPSACYTPVAGDLPCNVTTGATSTTNGSGNTATLALNYVDTDAARYCENMTYPAGGYTDWYLPSKDELDLVLYAMHTAGKGNFAADTYWSSTEATAATGWSEDFSTGWQNAGPYKTDGYGVRCVRKYL